MAFVRATSGPRPRVTSETNRGSTERPSGPEADGRAPRAGAATVRPRPPGQLRDPRLYPPALPASQLQLLHRHSPHRPLLPPARGLLRIGCSSRRAPSLRPRRVVSFVLSAASPIVAVSRTLRPAPRAASRAPQGDPVTACWMARTMVMLPRQMARH